MANTTDQSWDIASPLGSDPISDGDNEIRLLRASIADRMNKEHITLADGGVGGEHLAGSAMVYHQSADPTLQPDGATSLVSADKGRIFFDTDTNSLKVYSGSAWEAVDPGPDTVVAASIADNAVDKTHLNDDIVASAGAVTISSGELSVAVDASSIEISSNALQVAAGGITAAMLATGVLDRSYALLRHEVGSTTDGGSTTSGSWETRPVSTESFDADSIVTLSANQFTLIAGTYIVRWMSGFVGSGRCQSRLYDVTGAATEDVGSSGYADSSDPTTFESTGSTRFTIASPNVYRLESFCTTSNATDGFGKAVNDGSNTENQVYAWVEIIKEG